MCVTALTMSPVPASPFVRIIAAPSAIRRRASPRFVQPQTNGIVNCHLSTWCSRSAGVSTSPSTRMSAGTRSSAMTATAPASSAIFAWSAVTTSMITPPLSISASPVLTLSVPISSIAGILPGALEAAQDRVILLARGRCVPDEHEVLVALQDVVDGDRPARELAVSLLDALRLGLAVAEGHHDEVRRRHPHAHRAPEGGSRDEVDVLHVDPDPLFREEALLRRRERVGARLVARAAAAGDQRPDAERYCKTQSRAHPVDDSSDPSGSLRKFFGEESARGPAPGEVAVGGEGVQRGRDGRKPVRAGAEVGERCL